MDVILDSNILRSDFLLRSKEFEVLLNYLEKTESSIILPQIVLDEIKGLYTSTLRDRIRESEKVLRNINLMLSDSKDQIEISIIDVDDCVKKYEDYVIKKLKIKAKHIIPYKNDFLPEISHRAINRLKPAGEKGQGFRDVLIWLTIKDYCASSQGKQIIFISNNTDDFANKDKTDLDESLSDECHNEKVFILYFQNLKDFIEHESQRLDTYNIDWVGENIDLHDIYNQAIDDLNGRERRSIESWFQRETGFACTGYEVKNIDTVEIENPTVYEMSIDKLIVNVEISVELEIEFEFEDNSRRDEIGDKMGYGYYTSVHYLKGYIYLSVTVEDNEIQDTELTDIDV